MMVTEENRVVIQGPKKMPRDSLVSGVPIEWKGGKKEKKAEVISRCN